MPNIRSQRVEDGLLEIVASDRRTFTLTSEDIRAIHQRQTGTPAERRQKTSIACRNALIEALGEEQIAADTIELEVDGSNGRISRVAIKGERNGDT